MSAKLKTFYCDARLVATVTLKTLARSEDEAIDNFQNARYITLDRKDSVDDPKAFLNVRTTPEKAGTTI